MHWDYLKKNDVVDIIAPASHSPQEKLEEGLEWISTLGLIPRVPEKLITPDVFFASPLENQLEQLQRAIYSDSRAIWCLRGGYGSMRLIPHLRKLKAPRKPKIFIGFSDITSLHLFFIQQWKWPTLHGRTISQLSYRLASTPDRQELAKVLFGKIRKKTFKKLIPLNAAAMEMNTYSAKITGGNLRIIQSSLGTSWEIKTKGKFLFIEDVAERGYSVDRMLEQLYQARLLDRGPKGLLIGDFTQGLEKDSTSLIQTALERFAQRVSYPVIQGIPAGHGEELNYTIPFNTPCELITGKNPSLTCEF